MDLLELSKNLTELPADKLKAMDKDIEARTAGMKFIPSPGPQTEAWYCEADLLLYGGEAGGGKSGLLCGLALQEHHRSLLMRRNGVDLEGGGGLIDELKELDRHESRFSGKPPQTLRRADGGIVTFGSATNEGDETKFQGRARDFLGIDEATQFTERQVRYLMGWVRSTKPGQRTRTVLATNPPIDSTGDWIIDMFAPWLDPNHDWPAKHGELRWFLTIPDGEGATKDVMLKPDQMIWDRQDGRPRQEIYFDHQEKALKPESRTFIPAKLTDNPFLPEDYQSKLDAMPEPYRSAMREGNFMAARKDRAFQVIPTQWIREAQARWREHAEEHGHNVPPKHAPMGALGVDIAQGGGDNTILSPRYDAWFAELQVHPGSKTPTGNEVAGLIIAERRNGAQIVLDMGGGYGGATKMRLEDNKVEGITAYKGANKSYARSADKQFGFYNKRAEMYWRLREALDPAQDGGSVVMLPDDNEMVTDLTAPDFTITPQGVKITPKEDLVKQLGRSPDKGDAVVMANGHGPKLMTHGNDWRGYQGQHGKNRGKTVKVVQKHQAARRSR